MDGLCEGHADKQSPIQVLPCRGFSFFSASAEDSCWASRRMHSHSRDMQPGGTCSRREGLESFGLRARARSSPLGTILEIQTNDFPPAYIHVDHSALKPRQSTTNCDCRLDINMRSLSRNQYFSAVAYSNVGACVPPSPRVNVRGDKKCRRRRGPPLRKDRAAGLNQFAGARP